MKLEFESNTATSPYISNNFAHAVSTESNAARVSQMLQAGIKAAQSGNRSEARPLLLQVTEVEPENETAWLWMASISEYPEELIIFLNNVLGINPNNARAVEWMQATKSLIAKTFVERGIGAMKDTNKDFARQCFLQAIVNDKQNETAWESLASIADSTEEKISHLQKVLNINPHNEAAASMLQGAKTQIVEAILQKANRAAISGEREAANEMLREVLKHSPELEEAWILKSYLANSFSEKITCFERVLSFNPDNEMAISGLASLRAMMAKTETKKAEQAAMMAQVEQAVAAEEVLAVTEEQYIFAEIEDEENKPTQKLEFPPGFTPVESYEENDGNLDTPQENENVGFSIFAEATQNYGDSFPEQDQDYALPTFEEDDLENAISTENDFMNYQTTNEQFTSLDETANSDYMPSLEQTETNLLTQDYTSNEEFLPAPAEENFGGQNFLKSSVEMADCPFCNAENETNAFVCGSCRTILTLSDLEMLLAHTEADRETLLQAVERMETETNHRQLSADELKNLAVAQINLKNLRMGVMYLQKAAQMNPNEVMLASQVNFLKIRLSEIEQQEIAQSSMSRGRKILIVDDSATVRKLISSKLEKSGHDVVCAVDGIDALVKIKDYVPDLILLDIMMPQLDGYQVCKLIRTNEATKDVPIVMISGKDGFFDKVRGRMAGTTGYITKPFGPETLMKTIETYIVHRGEMITEEEVIG